MTEKIGFFHDVYVIPVDPTIGLNRCEHYFESLKGELIATAISQEEELSKIDPSSIFWVFGDQTFLAEDFKALFDDCNFKSCDESISRRISLSQEEIEIIKMFKI